MSVNKVSVHDWRVGMFEFMRVGGCEIESGCCYGFGVWRLGWVEETVLFGLIERLEGVLSSYETD